jgi:hypothetical protein
VWRAAGSPGSATAIRPVPATATNPKCRAFATPAAVLAVARQRSDVEVTQATAVTRERARLA